MRAFALLRAMSWIVSCLLKGTDPMAEIMEDMEKKKDLLRSIPSVDELLKDECLASSLSAHGTGIVTDAVRKTLDALRAREHGREVTAVT